MINSLIRYARTSLHKIDWRLLLFLLLVVNVKLVVKLLAIAFVFIVHPSIKYLWRKRFSPVFLFYSSLMLIALMNAIISGNIINPKYDVVLLAAFGFWGLCLLSSSQVRLFAEENAIKIENTLIVFILINAIVSFGQLVLIMLDAGTLNPYTYQGEYQKYFISTGDYIKGVSFDNSTTNAAINAMAVIYFLGRNKFQLVFVSMAVMLVASSNLVNILLLLAIVVYFIYKSSRLQKSAIVLSVMMLVVFMVRITPQNKRYTTEIYKTVFDVEDRATASLNNLQPLRETPGHLLNGEQRKEKFALLYLDSVYLAVLASKGEDEKRLEPGKDLRPLLPTDNIHTVAFQHKDDTNAYRLNLLKFISQNATKLPIASGKKEIGSTGKLEALKNDFVYLREDPGLFITGTGAGNYSSKIAFRASGLGMAGSYPASLVYIFPDFLSGHLDIYLYYFSQPAGSHSVLNTPNSVYGQLLMEYGLTGLAVFIAFYFWYFFRNGRNSTYQIPMLLLFFGLLAVEYWFEQLSIVILFELMMFSSIYQPKPVNE